MRAGVGRGGVRSAVRECHRRGECRRLRGSAVGRLALADFLFPDGEGPRP